MPNDGLALRSSMSQFILRLDECSDMISHPRTHRLQQLLLHKVPTSQRSAPPHSDIASPGPKVHMKWGGSINPFINTIVFQSLIFTEVHPRRLGTDVCRSRVSGAECTYLITTESPLVVIGGKLWCKFSLSVLTFHLKSLPVVCLLAELEGASLLSGVFMPFARMSCSMPPRGTVGRGVAFRPITTGAVCESESKGGTPGICSLPPNHDSSQVQPVAFNPLRIFMGTSRLTRPTSNWVTL